MNKLTRKIASIITAAAVAFGSIGALPDTGVFPSLVVPVSATSPWWVTSGEGTASSPYLISNSQQWSTSAMYINTENSTYGDKYYKLTADITVDTNDTSAIFVGGSTGPFRGHFDGGGHTLTFNYIGIAEGAAPFRYVSGATIENLKVTGTISINGGKHYAAGIAGYVTGDTTINNCTSSVTIDSSGSSGSGRFGGLVGEVSSGVTLNINNCVFNGSMTGSVTMACGGFVGYNLGTVNITDCLLDPGSIGVGMYSFVQDWSNGISSLTRAYRTYDFSGSYDQGIRVYTDAPANAFSKKVKIFTNDYYWQPGTAAITGVESSYPLTGDSIALPACGVSLDGEALSSSDYTVTVTNSSSQTVSSITDAGTYTLTVTGKGDYSGSTLKTFKVYGIDSIPYIDATGDEKEAGSAIRLESATLPEGDWWYVTGETTINSRISISGTKHLILTDGAVLNIPKGIQLASGNTLNIYGQSGNTGKLVITGVESQKAGIGGNSQQSCGTLTVNGGDITVTGGTYGAGIGGGYSDNGNAHGGTVTINGGNVTAKGGSNGDYYTVGIGGGGSWKSDHVGGNGGTIVINGGIVSATGFKGCAGMGGGRNCADKGTVTINWKNASDRVYASSYNSTVTVSGDYVHEGTSTKATSENIGGKTLVPAKKITIGTVTNGTIALPNDAESGSYFGIGSTVTLNVTPDISYAIESVKYGTTEIVPVSGVYSFVMPANDVTVTATFVYDPSHFSVNEAGTEYTIHDSTGWNQFCAMVNSGTDFAGKTVILGESIFVSTTAGTSDHKFKGTFDGGSNTLTFNKTGVTTDNCAPFLYIEGATIQNLNIAGNITTSKKFAASLAAHTYGTTNITNCHSTVTITSSATSSGDGTHGGFVAVNEGSATLNFTGCSFKGSMLGSNANSNGGFVGYNSGTIINYTDCLFAPSEISMSGSNSCTFNRNGRNLFTNTYYTTVLGTAEGKRAYTITAADENISVALAEGSTAGVSFGDTIYGAENDIVSLTLSHTTPAGKTFSSYTASAGTLTGTENPYTLTMPAGNVTVSAEFEGGSLETVATPTFSPAEGSYIGTQSVEISCETDGATIYYTTDGTDPNTSSMVYSSAIAVSETTTIKAIAVNDGMTDSDVATATYTINISAPIITTQPVDLNLLNGASSGNVLTVAAQAIADHTLSYQWYSNTTNSNEGGSVINGATSASYTVPTNTDGTTYYYCVVTATHTNGQTATATSAAATVTVTSKTDAGASISGVPPIPVLYLDKIISTGSVQNPGTNGTWTWTSSDPEVLGITPNGAEETIEALKVGTATITASYESDTTSGSATVELTVYPKSVTITGLTVSDKEYDGTTAATVTGTADIDGKIGNDDVTVTAGTAEFADKNVGAGKTVTFSGYSLSGTAAGNYELSAQPASVTANITPKEVTVSGITANDKTYDGTTDAELVTAGAAFDGICTGDTLTVTATGAFEDANAGIGKTVTIGGLTLGGADAGNYVLAASGQQTDTTADITPKSITGATVTLNTTRLEYSGTEQSVSVTSVTLDDKVLTTDDYDVSGNSGTNKDTYTVIVTGKGNYTETATAAWAITNAKAKVTTAPTAKTGLKYTGAAQALVTGGAADTSIEYALGTDADTAPVSGYIATVPSEADAKTYYVWYRAKEDANHTAGDPAVLTVTIARAAATVTADDKSKEVGANDPTFTATVTGTYGSDTLTYSFSRAEGENVGAYTITPSGNAIQGNYDVTFETGVLTITKKAITPTVEITGTYTFTGEAITPTFTVKNGETTLAETDYTVSYSNNIIAGENTASMTVSAAESSNYTFTDVTKNFSIAKAAITPTVSIANWVYGTTASTPNVSGNPGNGAVTYEYKAGGGTYSSEVPTAVGSYTIKAVVAETANYLSGEATATFSITKAPAGCTAPTANSLTYTGSAQALVTAGNANGGTMHYSLDGTSWSTTVPTGVNAGSYTVYYKVIGDANHSDTTAQSVDVVIAKADATCMAPTANSLTYTGSALALVSAGSTSDGEIQYSLDGTSWSTTIPTGTDAGSYTVYYKVIGDANHRDTTAQSVDVVIAKAASSCTAPTANSLTYTGSALALVTAGTANGGTMQYSLDGTSWNAAIPTGTNAGSYTVYYKVVGDGNHNDTESQSVNVTVGKASDKPLKNVTDTLLRSAKSISISVASAVPSDAGTIGGYAVNGTASTTGAVTVSNAAVSAAGLVTAALSGGAANDTITVPVKITAQNYDCTINVVVTLTELADPVFTAPTAKTLTYNGTAQELVIAGTVTTGGAMQYSTDGASWSTTVPTAANAGSYTVYYKIDETDEVNGIEAVQISVSIARKAAVVTADNKTRVVAAPDPELTATVTGLVGSDTVNYTLSREAGEKVGIYAITPSGDAVQGNYTVTYQPGTLTIADVYVDGKPVDSTFTDILKNAAGDTVTITLGKNVIIEKLTFPKEKDAKEIIIDGNGYTVGFTESAAIKPNQKLTLVNVEITAEKNDKPQNITITAAKGGLTLENVTLNGKKATVTASSGDLTLDNVSGNELTVKGAAKTTLTANGDVDATTVSGFGTVNVNGTLNVTKTLTVNELTFADSAVLKVAGGADVTVKKGISGNGTLHIAEDFKPITLNGDITGNIKLASDKPMADGTLLFKSKLTDLNEHFDISGIAPAVTDGEYEYGLYSKSGKVYLYAYRFTVDGTAYAVWTDAMNAITKAKASGKIYAIELLGNIDLGKTFKLPTKGKYAGLTIDGNGHTITFSGRTITLTGDLTLTDLTLNSTATKGCTIKQGKFKLDAGGAELVNCTTK